MDKTAAEVEQCDGCEVPVERCFCGKRWVRWRKAWNNNPNNPALSAKRRAELLASLKTPSH